MTLSLFSSKKTLESASLEMLALVRICYGAMERLNTTTTTFTSVLQEEKQMCVHNSL